MMFFKKIIYTLILSLPLVFTSISTANATDSNWHADTKSYRVYLGVVPTSMIKKNLTLIDQDKSLQKSQSRPVVNHGRDENQYYELDAIK